MSDKKPFPAWLVLGALALGLLFWALESRADVCTSANCATKKPVSAMVSSDPVTWCDGQSSGFTCSNPKPITWGGTASFTRILTDTGYFSRDSIPTTTAPPVTPPFVYKPPKCFDFSTVRMKWEASRIFISIWCEHNDGIKWSGRIFDLTKQGTRTTPTPLTETQVMDIDKAVTTRALTAAELIELEQFSMSFGPTAKVVNSTVGGVIVGPPKYERTVNGTLGKAAGRASKDQACMPWSRLVDAAGKATSYYRLIGEEYYARCTVSGRYVKLGNQ